MKRWRLDALIVERKLLESRAKAQLAILEGRVMHNGQLARKASDWAVENDCIEIMVPEPYVSRGGLKLAHALDCFTDLPLKDAIAMDIGASTGGFTDCMLQRGVKKVYAIDVGQGQLAWKLRQDPRVIVMERVNARFLTKKQLGEDFDGADLIVVDCSFISLKLILPSVLPFLKPVGHVVALIKPQFEAGRVEVSKGRGVIRDENIHQRILSELQDFVGERDDVSWIQHTKSPILGPAGNREFLVHLKKHGTQ